jgi:hypothetical protein
VRLTVLEIFKPAFGRAMDVLNDYLQAVAIRAFGLGANRLFELACLESVR